MSVVAFGCFFIQVRNSSNSGVRISPSWSLYLSRKVPSRRASAAGFSPKWPIKSFNGPSAKGFLADAINLFKFRRRRTPYISFSSLIVAHSRSSVQDGIGTRTSLNAPCLSAFMMLPWCSASLLDSSERLIFSSSTVLSVPSLVALSFASSFKNSFRSWIEFP